MASFAQVPYENDEVTRLVLDRHDVTAFAPVAHLTVGDFRDWLLAYETDGPALGALAPGRRPRPSREPIGSARLD